MSESNWRYDQPLRADATDHQIVERNTWWVWHQPKGDNTPAVVRTARELAAAMVAVLREQP